MTVARVSVLSLLMALGGSLTSLPSFAQEDAQVKAILKRNDCLKCHAVDKTKKGPSYKKIAEKLKSKPRADAERIVHDQLTKAPKVKLEDGTEEEHKVIDTKDPKDFKAITDWLLSL